METTFLDCIEKEFHLKQKDIRQYSPLTLAFIGDSIFDVIIRTIVVDGGNAPVNQLHKKVSSIVKAAAQAKLLHHIESELTEEELLYYKRGRNAKSCTCAKNASVIEYRTATGLECLMGYLYLTRQEERMLYLIRSGLEIE